MLFRKHYHQWKYNDNTSGGPKYWHALKLLWRRHFQALESQQCLQYVGIADLLQVEISEDLRLTTAFFWEFVDMNLA